jgi:hypothetical protein
MHQQGLRDYRALFPMAIHGLFVVLALTGSRKPKVRPISSATGRRYWRWQASTK